MLIMHCMPATSPASFRQVVKNCGPTPHMHLQSGVEWPKLDHFAQFMFLHDRKEHRRPKNRTVLEPEMWLKGSTPIWGTCHNTLRGPNQVLMVTMGAYGPLHLCCTKNWLMPRITDAPKCHVTCTQFTIRPTHRPC